MATRKPKMDRVVFRKAYKYTNEKLKRVWAFYLLPTWGKGHRDNEKTIKLFWFRWLWWGFDKETKI